jgi:hypothetical protein
MVRKVNYQKGSLLEQTATEVYNAWNASGLFNYSRDKVIVYVRTRDEADDLASTLLYESYTL